MNRLKARFLELLSDYQLQTALRNLIQQISDRELHGLERISEVLHYAAPIIVVVAL